MKKKNNCDCSRRSRSDRTRLFTGRDRGKPVQPGTAVRTDQPRDRRAWAEYENTVRSDDGYVPETDASVRSGTVGGNHKG